MTRLLLSCITLFTFCLSASGQTCTTRGQNPSSAFPVCGTTTFLQNTVPECGGRPLKVPNCNDGAAYGDLNPFWYKFTCYQSGSLGFLIRPNNQSDDYDWQLYDITNRNPDDVYTDASLVVIGNWAGTPGNTGASTSGSSTIECASIPSQRKNTFSTMPNLIQGHTYLLLVSHYDGSSQSGYGLSFGGGTAVITDPVIPHLKTASANCDGDAVRIKLDKKILCNSISANGSEFTISAPGINVTGATAAACSQQFDTDFIELQLSGNLAPGTYQVTIKKGTDGNTLLDECGNPVPESDVLNVTMVPKTPTPMDSLVPPTCAPRQLKLVFNKPMLCASIAPNGSDFVVNGTYAVAATAASGINCTNGTTQEVLVTLAKPMETGGNFQLVLQRGTDGNSIINECGMETAPGAALPFVLKDTVNADFTYTINYGCEKDTILFSHPGDHNVTSWKWNLDDGQQSRLQNSQGLYTVFNEKNIELIVTNDFCSDTLQKEILLENSLLADFDVIEDNCPSEPIQFTSLAKGIQLSHAWSFGDGGTGTAPNPKHTYTVPPRITDYNVRYTITDKWGCQKTAQKPIRIYTSCYIAVPNAFTPNGDGLNETIRPLNAIKATGLEFTIYNRWGQLIFKTQNWKQGWDGKFKGHLQPSSVYVWTLRYTDRDSKQNIEQKGTFVLIR